MKCLIRHTLPVQFNMPHTTCAVGGCSYQLYSAKFNLGTNHCLKLLLLPLYQCGGSGMFDKITILTSH